MFSIHIFTLLFELLPCLTQPPRDGSFGDAELKGTNIDLLCEDNALFLSSLFAIIRIDSGDLTALTVKERNLVLGKGVFSGQISAEEIGIDLIANDPFEYSIKDNPDNECRGLIKKHLVEFRRILSSAENGYLNLCYWTKKYAIKKYATTIASDINKLIIMRKLNESSFTTNQLNSKNDIASKQNPIIPKTSKGACVFVPADPVEKT